MKVSIGIPFYNPGEHFELAIKSVLAQSHQDWELILIDDGSIDDSLEIAKSVLDSRVRVISDGMNLGLPARLNQIVREARFEYIARFDADDLMSTDRIAKQLSYLSCNPDKDLVGSGLISFKGKDSIVGARGPKSNEETKVSLSNLINGRVRIVHASIIAKKSWFQRNPYNEAAKLMEDYELWIDSFIKKDFNIGFVAENLYYYREDMNVTYHKMINAYKNQIRLICFVKKDKIPFNLRFRFLMRSISKIFVLVLLNTAGKLEVLQVSRNKKTPIKLKQIFHKNLDIINCKSLNN
jgi:glycosyltransferase involved in cell wall biosynthesis